MSSGFDRGMFSKRFGYICQVGSQGFWVKLFLRSLPGYYRQMFRLMGGTTGGQSDAVGCSCYH